ncbi:hypothetical protein [Pedobacter jamesrossensis]|uniref:DKNYY family protein n=1 Tax=Pedobacter jamesrossensis TaxID=1908238 RepID=A0ABV8NKP1_9SPHI
MSVYKKNIILLAILILCFVLTIAYGYAFRNFISQPNIPAKYNEYKSIHSGVNSKHFELKQVLNGELNNLYFEQPIFADNFVIIHATSAFSNRPKNIYYKIDSAGKLADSLIYKTDEYPNGFLKGYLVHQDYYLKWALNGDTAKHKYILINYDLKLDSASMLNQFFKLNSEAKTRKFIGHNYLWKNDDPKWKSEIDKVLLLINDKWYAYYGANLKDYEEINEPDTIPNQLKGEQVLGKPENNFEVVYFHKTSQITKDWFGQAFVNLKIGNDTLNFKHEMRFNEDKKTCYYRELKMYNNPKSNLQLLGNGRTGFYVIKPKSK